MAVTVIAGPQFVVRKHFEGPGRLFEAIRGRVVAGVLVRVELDGQLAIRVGYLRAAGAAFHSQHLVVVALVGHVGAVQTQMEASGESLGLAFPAATSTATSERYLQPGASWRLPCRGS